MMPVLDRPTIQYVVEEAVNAGIDDILLITGRGKQSIERHFDKSYEWNKSLNPTGKAGFDRFETFDWKRTAVKTASVYREHCD